MVHVRRENTRANCLNIINERSEDVFSILNGGTRKMRFKGMGKDRTAVEDGELLLAVPDETLEEGSDRYTDQILETPLGPEGLARRLLRLSIAAKTAEEEQGLNILYLAMGFLRWKESEASDIVREAPLLLVPVDLVRNERTSAFDIRMRDDDLSANLPLRERLMQDEGISLPELPDGDDLSPEAYFDQVAEAIASKPSWDIDRNGMQLGFFSFAKLLMHRDLNPEEWSGAAFEDNALLTGLLEAGFEAEDPLFGAQDRLDQHLDPAEIIQVVDADASQTKVIEEVRRGASMVVQGPPGTGKSQTIANMIAGAVHDGKTVLFVAEKMAALSVVHDRLVKVGLRDVCLELHSRTANKKALARELGRTLMASATKRDGPNETSRLRQDRDELNRIVDMLHRPSGQSGDSAFQTMSDIVGFIGAEIAPPRIDATGLERMGAEERSECVAAIERFLDACNAVPAPDRHPFRATTKLDLQPTDLTRLQLDIGDALDAILEWHAEAERCSGSLSRPAALTLEAGKSMAQGLRVLTEAPPDAADSVRALFAASKNPRLAEGLDRGAAWRQARTRAEGDFAPSAFDTPTGQMRSALVQGQGSIWSRMFGPYRKASKALAGLLVRPLPKAPGDRLALIDALEDVQAKRRALADDEGWLQRNLVEVWRGESTDFEGLQGQCDWLRRLLDHLPFETAEQVIAVSGLGAVARENADRLDQTADRVDAKVRIVMDRLGLDLAEDGSVADITGVPITNLQDRLTGMQRNPGGYADWAGFVRASAEAAGKGGGAIVEAVRTGKLPSERAVAEFLYACAEARWADIRAAQPDLNGLSNKDRSALVASFQARDRARLQEGRDAVLTRHMDQMPKGATGEMGILRGEMGKKTRHRPIRWLMTHAGSMLQRIKPVMLMSPLSVAQFLPPGKVSFDLLIIDEASQVRPEDALGVVARARQIVVVGDTQQLPPTNFFSRLVEDVEDDEDDIATAASAAEMESVLKLCEARGLKPRMLEWHYRSRDPSLIRVSNAEFYEDRLVLPPSPLEKDENYGLKFRKVPGVYASASSGLGRAGTNRIEAEEIAAAVAQHARDWPKLSLGVVAFSKAQATMITEVLELARRDDAVLDGFLRAGKTEDLFVKNIENVQGDERDVIFVSVGYGPAEPGGRLRSMSFGPINSDGGERRLNVLFSRSRLRCEIFASFDPGDIDLGRTQKEGPRVLKRFLDYARSGIMEDSAPTGEGADSPFEEDVAREIRKFGYLADHQVGSAGFRIDLGVRHPERPGQYFLAVECDGATYHSALWARERDRLRQEVLEHLGWRFHRIWSTDWFHRREQEIAKLARVLEMARTVVGDGIKVEGANEYAPVDEEALPSGDPNEINIADVRISVPTYERANVRVNTSVEPHLVPLPRMAEIVARVIEEEGPIHLDEVARRVATAFGRAKAGKRIVEATRLAVRHANPLGPELHRDGEFVMTRAQYEVTPVRDRSDESDGVVKAEYLPPSEIVAAATLVRQESGAMDRDELIRTVRQVLGFKRAGAKMYTRIDEALSEAGFEMIALEGS